MKQSKKIVFGVLALTGTLSAVLLLGNSSLKAPVNLVENMKSEVEVATTKPKRGIADSESIQHVNTRLDELTLQLATLMKRIESMAAQSQDGEHKPLVESEVSTEITELEKITRANKEMQDQALALDNRFQAQITDPSWSQEAEERLQFAFESPDLVNHTIGSVDCRATMCKLEVVPQKNGGNPGGFHTQLRDKVSDIFQAGEMRPNGSGGVTMYLAENPDDLTGSESSAR